MTKATTSPTDIVLEHLKRMQTDLADLKRDVRGLKGSNATILGMIGELVKATGQGEGRLTTLEIRVERIENRLDLRDHSPA